MSNYRSFIRAVEGQNGFGGLKYEPTGKAGNKPRSKFTFFRSGQTRNLLNLMNRFTGSSSIRNSYKQLASNARQKLAAGGSRKNAINSLQQIIKTIRSNNRRNYEQGRLSRDIQNRKRRINAALQQGNITQNQAANFKAALDAVTLNTSNINKRRIFEQVTRAIKMENFRRQINTANIAQNKKNMLLRLLNNPNKSTDQINIAISQQIRLVKNYKKSIENLNSHISRLQSSNDPNKQSKIRNIQRIRNALKSQLGKTNIFTPNYHNSVRMRERLGTTFASWANHK